MCALLWRFPGLLQEARILGRPGTSAHSLQMGSVARTIVDNVKSATARRNTLVRSRRDSKVLTMPPKKSTAANRTVRRTYSSDERLACWAAASILACSASARLATSLSGEAYSAIARGRTGALGLLNGSDFSHASTALRASGRKRTRAKSANFLSP